MNIRYINFVSFSETFKQTDNCVLHTCALQQCTSVQSAAHTHSLTHLVSGLCAFGSERSSPVVEANGVGREMQHSQMSMDSAFPTFFSAPAIFLRFVFSFSLSSSMNLLVLCMLPPHFFVLDVGSRERCTEEGAWRPKVEQYFSSQ